MYKLCFLGELKILLMEDISLQVHIIELITMSGYNVLNYINANFRW